MQRMNINSYQNMTLSEQELFVYNFLTGKSLPTSHDNLNSFGSAFSKLALQETSSWSMAVQIFVSCSSFHLYMRLFEHCESFLRRTARHTVATLNTGRSFGRQRCILGHNFLF